MANNSDAIDLMNKLARIRIASEDLNTEINDLGVWEVLSANQLMQMSKYLDILLRAVREE